MKSFLGKSFLREFAETCSKVHGRQPCWMTRLQKTCENETQWSVPLPFKSGTKRTPEKPFSIVGAKCQTGQCPIIERWGRGYQATSILLWELWIKDGHDLGGADCRKDGDKSFCQPQNPPTKTIYTSRLLEIAAIRYSLGYDLGMMSISHSYAGVI